MVNLARLLSVVGVAGMCAAARANTIQTLFSSSAPSGPNTVYTYQLDTTANNGLQGGSSDPSALVILDFPGVVSVGISSIGGDLTATSDWSLTTTSTGAGTLPDSSFSGGIFTLGGFAGGISANDTATTNIVLQYVGAGMAIPLGSSNSPLLHLTVTSSVSSFSPIQSVSRNTAPGVPNETDSYPVLSQGGGGVPEPASLGLLGVGAAALVLRRWRHA